MAIESGFSQATVARVFSSPRLVSENTRRTVEAAAERLGYVPNAIARSLKSQRTNIVGAVVPAVGEYWQHALTSISRQLAARGQQLLLFSFADAPDVSGVLESVRQYRLDGLVVASANISQTHLTRLTGGELPVVAFNQPAAAGIVPSVSVDNEAGAAALADHLVDQGCSSVLFVGGVASASTDQIRYRGAARALGSHGIGCAYIEAGSFGYEDGYKVAERIAELPERPDAVMVAGDELAFGVVDGLGAAGLRVPHDLLLTGFDGLPQASWAGYDLTTLVQNVDALVEQTLVQLLDLTDQNELPDIVVPGTIRLGATTRRPTDG
ncbi:MAG: LacI family DNA-binding transcriptional regulator [Acidimicrobiales bacterium]